MRRSRRTASLRRCARSLTTPCTTRPSADQFRSPELAALYSQRYVDRVLRYHAGIFRDLIAAGEIREEDPDTLALLYVAPVLTLIGICDRQPEREDECLRKLREHVELFFRMTHPASRKEGEP